MSGGPEAIQWQQQLTEMALRTNMSATEGGKRENQEHKTLPRWVYVEVSILGGRQVGGNSPLWASNNKWPGYGSLEGHEEHPVVCWSKFNYQLFREPWFVVFASSHGVNAPTTARSPLNMEMGRDAHSWLSGGERNNSSTAHHWPRKWDWKGLRPTSQVCGLALWGLSSRHTGIYRSFILES